MLPLFFLVLFLGGGYFSIRFIVYKIVTKSVSSDIRFGDVGFSLFPFGVQIKELRHFPISHRNLLSFRSVNVTFLMRSLFAKKKAVRVEIDSPRIQLNESILTGQKGSIDLSEKWDIQRIDVINGEINFRSEDLDFDIKQVEIRSRLRVNGTTFQLRSPDLRLGVFVENRKVYLQGAVQSEFRQFQGGWRINRFAWQTRTVSLNGHGKIQADGSFSLHSEITGDPHDFLLPLLEEFVISASASGTVDVNGNRSGKVWLRGEFTAPWFRMKNQQFSELKGQVVWDNTDELTQIDGEFRDRTYQASVQIKASEKLAQVQGRRLSAASVARVIEIDRDVPLTGLIESAWMDIDDERIRGEVRLSNGTFSTPIDSPFSVSGLVRFELDQNDQTVVYSGERIQCNAGTFNLEGRTSMKSGDLDLKVDARLTRLAHLDPLARHFLELDLTPWKLDQGVGIFHLQLAGNGVQSNSRTRLELIGFTANGEPVRSFTGDLTSTDQNTEGRFLIDDPHVSAQVEYHQTGDRTEIDFTDGRGEIGQILRILGLDTDISGSVTGTVRYSVGPGKADASVDGELSADLLTVSGIRINGYSSQFHSNLTDIVLKNVVFNYLGGKGKGEVAIDYQNRRFAVAGSVTGFIPPKSQATGATRGSIDISGEGVFFQDPLRANIKIDDYAFYPDRPLSVRGEASILTDFSNYLLDLSGELLHGSHRSPFSLDLGSNETGYSGSFSLSLQDINLIIPWKNNIGTMEVRGRLIPLSPVKTSIQGMAEFAGDTLVLPGFPHALRKFKGAVIFQDQRFTIQEMQGEIGGGKVLLSGNIGLDKFRLANLDAGLIGQNMEIYPMDRTQCRMNANLSLRLKDQKLLLQGEMDFLSVLWEREVDDGISFYTSADLTPEESKILDMLVYDLHLKGRTNCRMNNSFGQVSGGFDLRLTGTPEYPVLEGVIDGKEGEIQFSDRKFKLLKAKLNFINKVSINPEVLIESETDIQNYRVRFDIKGTANHLRPVFSSSPPLPAQDVLALVSLGEIFKRSGSTELSSQIGSSSMLSGKLTETIKNQANQLLGDQLGIDLLRIDPLISGQSNFNSPSLTVGKSFSKDLIVVFSTNLSTSQQQILYFQYQLTPTISVIGMYNKEKGDYSVDIRYRKRR